MFLRIELQIDCGLPREYENQTFFIQLLFAYCLLSFLRVSNLDSSGETLGTKKGCMGSMLNIKRIGFFVTKATWRLDSGYPTSLNIRPFLLIISVEIKRKHGKDRNSLPFMPHLA